MAFEVVTLNPPVTQTLRDGKNVEYQLQYDKTNGDVRLIEWKVDGQRTGSSNPKIIFGPKDGNWNTSEIVDSKLQQTSLQNTYKTQIAQAVQGVANRSNTGANKPVTSPWVQPAAAGQSGSNNPAPFNPLTTPLANLPKLLGALADPFGTLEANSVNGTNWVTSNEQNASKETLMYPMNMDSSQDRLIIQCYRYNPPYQQSFLDNNGQNAGAILQNGVIRNTPLSQQIGGPIFLPMPNAVRDSSSVAWDVDAMNNVTMAATKAIGGNFVPAALGIYGLDALGKIAGVGQLGSAVLPMALQAYLMASAAGGAGKSAISMAALSGVLGKYGYDVSPESLLARGAGVIANSNQELLFKGAAMRTFSFSYQLTPRDAEEAIIVRSIIRRFKEFSAAKKLTGGAGASGDIRGGTSFFLGTPNIWTLKYATAGNALIKGVNFIKPSALTRFEVDYTPQNHYMADEDGNPMSYRISMDFSELEPIYNTDYSKETRTTTDAAGKTTNARSDLRQNGGSDWIGY